MKSKTSFSGSLCNNIIIGFIIFFSVTQFIACGPKQAPYFQGSFDTTKYNHFQLKETTIQKNDIISLTVFSDDPTASAMYNQPLASAGAVAAIGAGSVNTTSANAGYLVDNQGNIQFQGLGKLHVEGLTKSGLIQLLNEKLKDQLKNPYYAIRFLNYKITVQGEVNKGGTFNVPDERVTILEALALAGDMSVYANRSNIIVIRETNEKRELARVNITKPDIFNSPYYYLKQNDLVIVEPTKKKPSAGDQEVARTVSITSAIVYTLAVIYSLVKK